MKCLCFGVFLGMNSREKIVTLCGWKVFWMQFCGSSTLQLWYPSCFLRTTMSIKYPVKIFELRLILASLLWKDIENTSFGKSSGQLSSPRTGLKACAILMCWGSSKNALASVRWQQYLPWQSVRQTCTYFWVVWFFIRLHHTVKTSIVLFPSI